MSSLILGGRYVADPETGRFVNGEHQRIAEIINDWNPTLWLCFIPPENRRFEDTQPFAIIHRPPDKAEYIVLRCTEEEVNHRLIARLWEIDTTRVSSETRLNNLERAQELLRLKEKMDMREDMHDRARSMFHSNKHEYQLGGGRKVRL